MTRSASQESSVPTLIAPGLAALSRARWMTHKLTDNLGQDELFARACPGANHAVWVLGHIATTDDFFISTLGGRALAVPEAWNGLFGMKSEVSDDRSKYPGVEELRSAFKDRRAALEAWLSSLSDAELLAPIEGDVAGFTASRSELPGMLAFHEGFHAGQISVARRAGGKAPLF